MDGRAAGRSDDVAYAVAGSTRPHGDRDGAGADAAVKPIAGAHEDARAIGKDAVDALVGELRGADDAPVRTAILRAQQADRLSTLERAARRAGAGVQRQIAGVCAVERQGADCKGRQLIGERFPRPAAVVG